VEVVNRERVEDLSDLASFLSHRDSGGEPLCSCLQTMSGRTVQTTAPARVTRNGRFSVQILVARPTMPHHEQRLQRLS
jgi:hypothetical protein